MKKYILGVTCILLAFACAGFSSCNNEDLNLTNRRAIDNNAIMSPTVQKEYIEKVALELMDIMPASDFEEIIDLGEFLNKTYGKGSNFYWNNVGDWAIDIFYDLCEPLHIKTTESETKYYDYLSRIDYIYTEYKALLLISNLAAHFTERNGRWIIEEADDIQFMFSDRLGRQCQLKLETSGAEKRVYAANLLNKISDDYGQRYGKNYIRTVNYDRYQCTIGVPEDISIILLQDGKILFNSQIHINLESINENVDISKSDLNITCKTELYNNYSFHLSHMNYEANNRISALFCMSKGSTPLVTMGMASDLNDIPSVNVNVFSEKNFKDHIDFSKVDAKNVYVKTDIIGKIQIQGLLLDVRKYINSLIEADTNKRDEKVYKANVDHANTLSDVKVFYDGNDVGQAIVTLDSFFKENYYSLESGIWHAEPILVFEDGSSYATFSAFFNKRDFQKTIDMFRMLADRYANLANAKIQW